MAHQLHWLCDFDAAQQRGQRPIKRSPRSHISSTTPNLSGPCFFNAALANFASLARVSARRTATALNEPMSPMSRCPDKTGYGSGQTPTSSFSWIDDRHGHCLARRRVRPQHGRLRLRSRSRASSCQRGGGTRVAAANTNAAAKKRAMIIKKRPI
jgi:hypothetical protein